MFYRWCTLPIHIYKEQISIKNKVICHKQYKETQWQNNITNTFKNKKPPLNCFKLDQYQIMIKKESDPFSVYVQQKFISHN